MIDATKTIDLVKLRFYIDYLYNKHVYDEGESQYHKTLTTQVVETYVDPLNLKSDAMILDLGCGPGYFLDEMQARGFTNTAGITLSAGDAELCTSKGHTVKKCDLSFLPSKEGYIDESVDFIFLRHALEHSPYPIISLIEYNRVLKRDAKIYIEVPAPNCDRKHEYNQNHYSILGEHQLMALLKRTGFVVEKFNKIEFDLDLGANEDGTANEVREVFYIIIATKKLSLDIK